jgi:two-component system sensor histidine kinase KdpD
MVGPPSGEQRCAPVAALFVSRSGLGAVLDGDGMDTGGPQGVGQHLRRGFRAFFALPGAGYAISALVVGLATAVLFTLRGTLGKDVAALLYVPVVVACAGLVGRRGWWFTPALAFLALDYFFTVPYFTFYMYDRHDWLLLGVFLSVGLVSSLEVGRLRQRTREASGRLRDLLVLNQLSRDLVSLASCEDMVRVLGTAVRDSVERVVLFVSASGTSEDLQSVASEPSAAERHVARWVFANGKAVGLPESLGISRAPGPWPVSVDWPESISGPPAGVYLPLQSSAGRAEGVLLFGPSSDGPLTLEQMRLFVSVGNLVAAFLERHQLQSKSVALASLQEADKLKSGFLTAVSHDIKTPLAAAKVRVTGLLEEDVPRDEQDQRQQLTAVAANLDRLDVTIGDLLDLARLENDAWRPRFESVEIGEILSTMLSHLPEKAEARVRVQLPRRIVLVSADPKQLERAIRNVVENALAYSDEDIDVRVESASSAVTVTVADHGPGIPAFEQKSVFEPFYRGSAARGEASGTGLGLAITREIVLAHGGRLDVDGVEPHGTCLTISLPSIEEM